MLRNSWFKQAYKYIVLGENAIGSIFLLIVRLYWGWLLIFTGLSKWVHLEQIAQFFTSLHIPLPYFAAGLVATVETLGGISLFLGLFARILSIPLVINFVVAYLTAHMDSLKNFFANPNVFFKEEAFLYLYASLIVLCFGAGFFSFDYWLEKKVYKKSL